MAGFSLRRQGFIKRSVAASLLAALTGCSTVTPPPSALTPAPQPPSSSAAPALFFAEAASPVVTPAPPASPASAPARVNLFTAIAKRLSRKKAEPPVADPAPAADPAPEPEPTVSDQYLLTGEAALELERGHASWYGARFQGQPTASGEQYDMYALTAAHPTLPFGTMVRVRNEALGREVDVRINDRGPFTPGRVIDLSQAAAKALGLMQSGMAEVSLKVTESTYKRFGGVRARVPRASKKKIRSPARPDKRHQPAAKRRAPAVKHR